MYIFISTAAFTIIVVVILICIPSRKKRKTRHKEGKHIELTKAEGDKSSFPFTREQKGLKNLGNTCYMNSVLQKRKTRHKEGEHIELTKVEDDKSSFPFRREPKKRKTRPEEWEQLELTKPGFIQFAEAKNESKTESEEKGKHIADSVEDDKSSFPFTREPKGLKNLGNTCYMNSVLQVLMCTPMLRESLDKQWKQCKGMSYKAYKNAPHTGHLLDLCNYLHFPGTDTQKPSFIAENILESVQIAHPQFQKDKQNDSFQLFLALIGGIEDEFMKFRRQQGEEDFVMNNSPVSRLFGGRFMTEWYYEKCCHVECSLHKFTSLTIPVSTGGQGTAKYSIENGLSELLSKQEWPEGLFKCARCEGSSKVQSKMLIHTLPPVLVVHINRFEESPDGRLKKLKTKVKYNHTLEVKPFCYKGTDDSSTTYSLYGVVSHSGNISSGHYTAYVRLRPKKTMELPLTKTWVKQAKLKKTIEKELNEKYKSDVPQWMTSKSKLHTSTEPQTNSEDTWYWISDLRYTKMHSSLALESDGAYLLMYEQIQ